MSLTEGLQLPFGIQPVNPVPVDSWSGPYSGVSLQDAIDLANLTIPVEIRFQSMEVRLIVGGESRKFWYRDDINDTDLIEFGLGPIGPTGPTGPQGPTGFGVTSSFYIQGTTNYAYDTTSNIYRTGSLNIGSGTATDGRFVVSSSFGTPSLVVDNNGRIYSAKVGYTSTSLGYDALGKTNILSMSVGAYNTGIGYNALYNNTTGDSNTAIGSGVLYNNTFGVRNIGLGINSLYRNNGGQDNIAIGSGVLYNNLGGSGNIAIGSGGVMEVNISGSNNIAIGYRPLSENATASTGNTMIGSSTGMRTSTNYNTAVGFESLQYNTTGSLNTALGYHSVWFHQTGTQNTGIGSLALAGIAVSTGVSYNTALGYNSLGTLSNNSTYNTAIGHNSGTYYGLTTSSATYSRYSTYIGSDTRSYAYNSFHEVVIGASAVGNGSYSVTLGSDLITKTILKGNVGIGVTGPSGRLVVASSVGTMSLIVTEEGFVYNKDKNGIITNLAFGLSASGKNTTGTDNTAFGNYALYNNTNKNYNVAIGANTLFNNNADYNMAIGAAGLFNNTTGTQNTGIGAFSMYYNITGSFNTAIGVASLQNGTQSARNTGIGGYSLYNTKGSRNIGIGFFGGSAITTGNDNTVIGSDPNNNTDGLTTGSNNTIIGKVVTGITVGDSNTILGRVSGLSSGLTNSVILADGSGNIRFYSDNNGNVGIGTTSPSTKLHVYATQSGAFRLQDGTQASGYILTSDSNGVGTWVNSDDLFKGTSYIYVRANGTDTENGTELLNAYNLAKTMSPTASNRVTVIAGPGNYNFSSDFEMDTEYIDLVSLDGNRTVIFSGSGTLYVNIDNVFVKGIDVGDKDFKIGTFTSNFSQIEIVNCKGGDYSFGYQNADISGTFRDCEGGANSFAGFATASGTFINCIGGVGLFGGGVILSGTFIDCKGGDGSFYSYLDISGYLKNCEAGQFSFTGYIDTSGTFIDCKSGNLSFRGNLSGTFIGCEAGNFSFGDSANTISGYFKNCKAGVGSFGSDCDVLGTLINCEAGDGSFGAFRQASGKFINCISGDDSFGSNTSHPSSVINRGASGRFINCQSGANSFGSYLSLDDFRSGIASGTFINCQAGNFSFGSGGEASGIFSNCQAGLYSFGSPNTLATSATASGIFNNCEGGQYSFAGYGATQGTLSGKLYYCKLSSGQFATVSGTGRTYYCVDGNGNTNNQ